MDSNYWHFGEYGMPGEVLARATTTLAEPGPGEALVRIRSVGLNRSEFNYVQGRYVPVQQFPACLGQEAVGEVVALGAPDPDRPSPAGELTVGQRVAILPGRIDMQGVGTYRDAGVYPQAALAPVPDQYSDAEGAALWMGVLTMGGALELAGLTEDNAAGTTVLLTAAASGMGIIALKLLRAWGATTVATTRDAGKAATLATHADHVVVCENAEQLSGGIRETTGGFDVALDPVGEAFYPAFIETASIGANIVSYEMITGREPALPIAQVMIKDLALKGFTIFRVYRIPGLLEDLVATGMKYAADITPIVAATYPLAEAPAALEALGTSSHLGKITLDAS